MEVIKNGELLEHPKVTLATTQLERVIVNAENNVNDSSKKEEKMDNQQQSILEEKIKFLAKNATIGDGTLWKHPEVTNYKDRLENKLKELFGDKFGYIQKNNSKATENNKTWYIPLPIARKIMPYAEKYKALDYKILR